MIEHLSAEQISQWMIGERTPQLDGHLAECEECRAKLLQLESTLRQFRGAVRQWGGSTVPPVWRQPPAVDHWFTGARLALAAAALCVLVSLPLYWNARERERAAEAARAADAQLLERIDSSLSRAVPEPMEPLVNLVTWNSSATGQGMKAQSQ